MNILSRSISHSRATLSIIVFILLVGLGSRSAMNVELEPHVTFPVVLVSVTHQGISPQDANRLLIKPLEKELKSLSGLDEMRTTAAEGWVQVTVEFDISEDIDAALADVREAVDRAKSEFPEDTDEPTVKEVSTEEEPTLMVAFSGDGASERELFTIVNSLRRRIESLPSVLEANLSGAREEVVEAVIDPQRLEYYNLTATELLAAVQGNNLLIPAGEYDTAQGRFGVKVPGLIESRHDVLSLPVKSTPHAVVTLKDVAQIRRTFKDPSSFSHIDGRRAISIEVFRRHGSNAIQTVSTVRQLIDDTPLPQGVTIDYVFDLSNFTTQMVNELQGNILTAVVLVMSVVVATLGLRTGLLVGFGIPFSLLGAMIVVNLMGFTLNFMVIFGLLLALGMLIDGAIVIMEYAEAKQHNGEDIKIAYTEAVSRMAMPVIASTATTLAVFLPLLFWPGVVGRFMSYLPYTVFAVLAWSLTYALFFGPVMAVVIGQAGARRRKSADTKSVLNFGEPTFSNRQFEQLSVWYAGWVKRAVEKPLRALGITLLVLAGIFFSYSEFGRGITFFVDSEPSYGTVEVRAQGNLSIAERERLSLQVERIVLGIPGVKKLHATGTGSAGSAMLAAEKDQISRMLVEVQPRRVTGYSSHRIFRDIRAATADLAGIYVSAAPVDDGPPTGKDVQLQLGSDDRDKLYAEAARIRQYIENNVAGLRDIDDSLPLPGIDWVLDVDRSEAAMLGVDTLAVGNMVQLVTNGIKIGEFRPDDAEDEVEIRVRYPSGDRGILSLDRLRVTTPNGPVPVSSFVTRSAQPKVSSIQRIDQQEVIWVRANTEDDILPDDKVKEIQRWLAQAPVDPAVTAKFRGASEEQAESIAFLSQAFSAALFLMLVLMVMQFNSFYQAFLIMSAVIMSTAGVLLGLLLTQQPMSVVMSGVGIVALAGIVVNNNIVLIDTYNHLRRENRQISAAQAACEAAALRLRPVLLTTITTVVGLLPLAMNVSLDVMNRSVVVGGEVAGWWQQLASAIVNGLVFSTLLTLLVTPVMLALPDYLRSCVAKRKLPVSDET